VHPVLYTTGWMPAVRPRLYGRPVSVTGPGRLSRWQLGADATLAAGCAGLSASVLVSPPYEGAFGPAAWVLAFLHAAPVAGRRRAPRAAFAASAAAGGIYLASGYPMVGLALTALVVVYSLAAYTDFRDSLGGLLLVELVLVGSLAAGGQLPDAGTLIGNILGLVAAWVLGDATRRRWRLARLYRQRAEELEAAQTELARRAVGEERLRLARELHDVVAHSMSVIAVQAGTARMVLDDEAPAAKEAIAAIEASSRSALTEMRRLLGVLRDPAEVAALSPLPTLGDLDRLVAQTVESGTPVELRVKGRRRRLGPGIELAGYRIIQEALTNVRRHAPGSTAVVRVEYATSELVIEVQNDTGPNGAPTGSGGLGLVGMRERAALYGGTVEAKARGDGTFLVLARLPEDMEG
jgi:signal transduction histidine kinase